MSKHLVFLLAKPPLPRVCLNRLYIQSRQIKPLNPIRKDHVNGNNFPREKSPEVGVVYIQAQRKMPKAATLKTTPLMQKSPLKLKPPVGNLEMITQPLEPSKVPRKKEHPGQQRDFKNTVI
jgi:hypothetical protein